MRERQLRDLGRWQRVHRPGTGKGPGRQGSWDEWELATACLRLEEEPQAAGPGSALVHRSLTQLKEAVRPTLRSDRWS